MKSVEEWWVMYSLRFGPEQLIENWAEGEVEFLKKMADDFELDEEDPGRHHVALDMLRKLREKEVGGPLVRE